MKTEAVKLFDKLDIQQPSEMVVQKIKSLISSGRLHPGDYLPSERDLSEALGVRRSHVREALKQLQFFGIVETRPQDGTIVSNLGITILDNLFSSVLKLEKKDFQALIETRVFLEVGAAQLVALRASVAELEELARTHEEFRHQVRQGKPALEEDMAFHVNIADFCQNAVLASLLRLIMPDILRLSQDLDTCHDGRSRIALEDHTAILEAIQCRNADMAAEAMRKHLGEHVQPKP